MTAPVEALFFDMVYLECLDKVKQMVTIPGNHMLEACIDTAVFRIFATKIATKTAHARSFSHFEWQIMRMRRFSSLFVAKILKTAVHMLEQVYCLHLLVILSWKTGCAGMPDVHVHDIPTYIPLIKIDLLTKLTT